MADELLVIQDLFIEYHTDESVIHAVNGISLRVNKGETIGLVGETGAGKTTIAKSVMRLLPTPPSKFCGGRILFQDQDLMSLTEKQMRDIRGNKIAMIFQDPMTALNPIHRVGQQISEAIALHNNVSRSQAEIMACDMLEMVGIPAARYKEFPDQFSGGMKQRVVIAIALACNPTLLFADEPTTALDVTIQAQVLKLMLSLKEKLGTSVVLITHDLGVVAHSCNTVAVIYAGEIVEYGTVEHIFDFPTHPYTVGLFNSLPKLDSTDSRLKPIKGLMPDPTIIPSGCRFYDRCPDANEECSEHPPPMFEVSPGHTVRCLLNGGHK